MKSIVVFFIVSMAMTTNVYADKIYLKNGTVVEGKIIQVTEDSVEYDPAGSVPFEVLLKTKVVKITYDDGRIQLFEQRKTLDFQELKVKNANRKANQKYDIIYLRGGKIIEGKIVKITQSYIQYDPPGSRVDDIIMRKYIYQVQMSNGQIITMDK